MIDTEKVMIQKELAIIMSIDKRGKLLFYPLVELTQENGICVSTKTPVNLPKLHLISQYFRKRQSNPHGLLSSSISVRQLT